MEIQRDQGCSNGRSKKLVIPKQPVHTRVEMEDAESSPSCSNSAKDKSNDTTHNEDVTCKKKKYNNEVTCSRSSKEQTKKNIEDMNKMKKNMYKNSALHNKVDPNLQQRSVHGNMNPIVRLSCICKYFAGKGASKNMLHGTCCIKVNINVTTSSSSSSPDDDNVQTHPVSTDTNQSIVTVKAEASSSSSSACSSSSCSSVSEMTGEFNEQTTAKKYSTQPSECRGRPRVHHYKICHFGKHRKGTMAPGPLEAYNFRSSTVVNRFSSNPPLSSYFSPQEDTNIQGDESIFHGKDKALKRSKYSKQSNPKMIMRMRSSSSDGGSSSSATWRRGNRSALLVASSSRHANAMKVT